MESTGGMKVWNQGAKSNREMESKCKHGRPRPWPAGHGRPRPAMASHGHSRTSWPWPAIAEKLSQQSTLTAFSMSEHVCMYVLLESQWKSDENSMEFLWKPYEIPLKLLCMSFVWNSMTLLWKSYDIPIYDLLMNILWHSYAIPMKLLCMNFLWTSYVWTFYKLPMSFL